MVRMPEFADVLGVAIARAPVAAPRAGYWIAAALRWEIGRSSILRLVPPRPMPGVAGRCGYPVFIPVSWASITAVILLYFLRKANPQREVGNVRRFP